jgi:hypothetical protein
LQQKGQNVAKEIIVVESKMQAPTKESSKKTKRMHASVDTVSAKFIELDIGLNNGQCIC